MVDVSTELCGVRLINPIIAASGTFGYGYEFADLYDINCLGSIALKGTTREERYGNPTPRIAECSMGMINSVGLQNPGVDRVVSEELPKLRACYQRPVLANVSGFSADEYAYVAEKLGKEDQVGWIEVNISCPNVAGGGMSFGTSPELAAEVVRAVKKATDKPAVMKLTPNVSDIASIAAACEEAGADGICLINTLLGMRIDLKTKKPVLARTMGGYSGPAIKPLAVRMVYQVFERVHIPIIGCGGVTSAEDAAEMLLAGASAVEVGSANLVDPFACKKIVDALPGVLKKYGFSGVKEAIGGAHKWDRM